MPIDLNAFAAKGGAGGAPSAVGNIITDARQVDEQGFPLLKCNGKTIKIADYPVLGKLLNPTKFPDEYNATKINVGTYSSYIRNSGQYSGSFVSVPRHIVYAYSGILVIIKDNFQATKVQYGNSRHYGCSLHPQYLGNNTAGLVMTVVWENNYAYLMWYNLVTGQFGGGTPRQRTAHRFSSSLNRRVPSAMWGEKMIVGTCYTGTRGYIYYSRGTSVDTNLVAKRVANSSVDVIDVTICSTHSGFLESNSSTYKYTDNDWATTKTATLPWIARDGQASINYDKNERLWYTGSGGLSAYSDDHGVTWNTVIGTEDYTVGVTLPTGIGTGLIASRKYGNNDTYRGMFRYPDGRQIYLLKPDKDTTSTSGATWINDFQDPSKWGSTYYPGGDFGFWCDSENAYKPRFAETNWYRIRGDQGKPYKE